MRVSFLIMGIPLLFPTAAFGAGCAYFLTKAKVHQCREANLDVPEADTYVSEALPETVAPDDGRRTRVTCLCEYALSGSDPLCDPERTEEVITYLPDPDPRAACAPRNKACRSLCPSRWP